MVSAIGYAAVDRGLDREEFFAHQGLPFRRRITGHHRNGEILGSRQALPPAPPQNAGGGCSLDDRGGEPAPSRKISPGRRIGPNSLSLGPAFGDRPAPVVSAPCPVDWWEPRRQSSEFGQPLAEWPKLRLPLQPLHKSKDVAFGVACRIPSPSSGVAEDQDFAFASTRIFSATGRAQRGRVREDFVEQMSGAVSDRPALREALDYARSGDMLVVWKLDRLARFMKQLIETIESLRLRDIGFRSLTEAIDTTTAQGVLVFHMFSALAEFERALIRERTRAGLAAAKRAGRTGGRPPKLTEDDLDVARTLLANPDITVGDVADRLGVSPATLYRYLPIAKAANSHSPDSSRPDVVTLKELAKSYNVGRVTVSRLMEAI